MDAAALPNEYRAVSNMTPTPVSGFPSPALTSPSRSEISSTILFDSSKSNPFGLNDGYRAVHRLLKNRWRVANTKDALNIETLTSSRLVILAGPQQKYNEAEFNALRQFVDLGGNLLVLLGEGGEQQSNTNVNFLLEEYGIMINNGNKYILLLNVCFITDKYLITFLKLLQLFMTTDIVISTVYQKYFHPKECSIEDIQLWIYSESQSSKNKLEIVYSYGATLNVARPAVVMATTSCSCLPQQRPIAATYANPRYLFLPRL